MCIHTQCRQTLVPACCVDGQVSCPCHRGLWFCLVPAVPPGMYHLVPRCLSSFSHVVGDGIHSGVPSEEFHTLCPARPPAAESGLRHWGFGVWFPWHPACPSGADGLLFFFAPQGADLWTILGYSWQEGLTLESAGLRKGLVPHALHPSPPDGIGPRLGICTDTFGIAPLPVTHASNP